jgi:hypothetical protein
MPDIVTRHSAGFRDELKPGSGEHAERSNPAAEPAESGTPAAEAARALAGRFGCSQRQARHFAD